jgi:CysZ protein
MIPRTVLRELQKLWYFAPRILLVLILGFIPGLNAFAAILGVIFAGWMMAVQYIDYPADNHSLAFGAMRRYLEQHRLAVFGYGLLVFGLTLIPVINLIIFPAAVCGAVIFWVENPPEIHPDSVSEPAFPVKNL